MPPITPLPSHISHNWCEYTPYAEISKPPHQHKADTTPALRGPSRSNQPPQMAAAQPSNTKNSVYIQPKSNCVQLQSVANNASAVPANFSPNVVAPAAQAASGLPSSPINALPSGFQNTLKPYAMPMDK